MENLIELVRVVNVMCLRHSRQNANDAVYIFISKLLVTCKLLLAPKISCSSFNTSLKRVRSSGCKIPVTNTKSEFGKWCSIFRTDDTKNAFFVYTQNEQH